MKSLTHFLLKNDDKINLLFIIKHFFGRLLSNKVCQKIERSDSKFIFQSLIVVGFLTILQSNQSLWSQCNLNDYNALRSLYFSTDGDNWFDNTGWDLVRTSSPPANCDLSVMKGITTNNNRVTEIYLAGNNLYGKLPLEIGLLSAAKEIFLAQNPLRGVIPAEFGNINGLEMLSLSNCQFEGIIPAELGQLSNLTTLYLYNNFLSGRIPEEFAGLQSIQILFLQNNYLQGSIPFEFANFQSFTRLFVSNNSMSGCYAEELQVLCDQFIFSQISEGNMFDADWDDFCNSGGTNGACAVIDVSSCNVWPGDINSDGRVDINDHSMMGTFLNTMGPERDLEDQNGEWYAHPAEDWNIENEFNGIDIKHQDCDGNGFINEADISVVVENLGLTHDDACASLNGFAPTIYENTDYQVLLQPVDNLNNDDVLHVNVVLESKSGNAFTTNGGYFRIQYSNEVIDASMDFNNSWLGNIGIDLSTTYKNYPDFNEINLSYTRLDGMNITGKGVIGQLNFQIDNLSLRTNETEIEFNVFDLNVHDIDLNELPIENEILAIDFGNATCQPQWNINTNTPFQNLYKSSGELTTNGFLIVGEGQQVTYQGEERVRLNTNFSVKAGATFRASTENCM